ncbi:MAG: type I polyketide synthase, partial [Bacteroidota bacterium]
ILWENLAKGKNMVTEFPEDRWAVKDHFHPDKEEANATGRSYGKWGGFIDNYYHFDPLFFNISPLETELMNPKERLFLQCAWHTLEDAGYTPQSIADEQVGVFTGVTRGGIDPYKTSMFSIANRVSYVFNLHGPSITLDTACSSSLVAIHEACQHIHSGECSVALAGGVHAFLDPSHFAVLSSMYMLSPDGSSKAFGAKANGMVPGEGVGIVMLKSLDQAVADGDHIYGTIRGSATNHGGKTNGFTVPNPRAQRNLIQTAMANAGVNARDISYIEAHGTGTPLGDPIEIRGLSEAFKSQTSDKQYCKIGSLKTNIGHLEAAAGVSGLMKILLQMKHGKLVPSLHSDSLNAQINFQKTPFHVQQELEDWKPVDENGNKIARIAGVSSFGAGGSNAHLVIEEYPQSAPERRVETGNGSISGTYLIPFSAKGEDRLQELVMQYVELLKEDKDQAYLNIADLAYTLQIGRAAFDDRLILEVSTLDELLTKLEAYVAGEANIDKCYVGNLKKNKKFIAGYLEEHEVDKLSEDWAQTKNYTQLLDLWSKGLSFDWQLLYKDQEVGTPPKRISLPGYPFLKEYYGLPQITLADSGKGSAEVQKIHPLIHRNTSTFSQQQFTTVFDGEEFFLKDHVVKGSKFLPGVAYLEMINAALGLAMSDREDPAAEDHQTGFVTQLENVIWARPAMAGKETLKVEVALFVEDGGQVAYEISSGHGQSPANDINSQGTAKLLTRSTQETIDLEKLLAAFKSKTYSSEECYEIFTAMGIDYGPGHKGIEHLHVRESEVLAKLVLPAEVGETAEQFTLHPSLMDSAFQSIIGLMLDQKEKYNGTYPLPIPFALKELTVFDRCTDNMWVHIKMNGSNGLTGENRDFDHLSFDLDLIDESGKVCVTMKEYTARVLQENSDNPSLGTLYIQPQWDKLEMEVTDQVTERIVILPEGLPCNEATLTEGLKDVEIIQLRSDQATMHGKVEDYSLQVLDELQELMNRKPKNQVLIQLLIAASDENMLLSSIFGLIKTAQLENPKITAQLHL